MTESEVQRETGEGAPDAPAEGGLRLPFDPWPLLIGAAGHWRAIALLVLIFAVMGVGVALLAGKRVYQATTVLLYKPRVMSGIEKEEYVVPPLQTQANMVKIPANLDTIRTRLSLEVPLDTMGLAIEATVGKNTDLLFIRADWGSADTAAAIANTTAGVFLESQRQLRRVEAQRHVKERADRLATVRRRLEAADRTMQEFTSRNQVVDLDKEAGWYLDQLTTVERLLDQAKSEKRVVEQQAQNTKRIMQELQQQISQETSALADSESTTQVSVRIERLRAAILDDKTTRAALAELAQKEVALKIAQELKAAGGISDLEYQKAVSEYERTKALAVDTEQTRAWKGEVEKLEKTMMPVDSSRAPSAPVLRDIMTKDFLIQLDRVSVGEKVKQMEEAKARISAKLATLPQLQREFIGLKREVTSLEAEKKTLEDALAAFQLLADSGGSDFLVVSEAKPPIFPLKSRRKLLAVAFPVLGLLLGTGLALLREIADTTVRSGRDASLRLGLPLVGDLPSGGADPPQPGGEAAESADRFRAMVRQLRRLEPRRGARLVVASVQAGEGADAVAGQLAARLGRAGERVLLVDAAGAAAPAHAPGPTEPPRAPAPRWCPPALCRVVSAARARLWPSAAAGTPDAAAPDLRARLGQWVPGLDRPREGLAEAVADPGGALAGRVLPEVLPGVDCLPAGKIPLDPDLVGSPRVRQQMGELASRYDLVLIAGPPIQADSGEAVAQWAEGLLLVVRSRAVPAARLKTAVEQLRFLGVPASGVIVTNVERRYLGSA